MAYWLMVVLYSSDASFRRDFILLMQDTLIQRKDSKLGKGILYACNHFGYLSQWCNDHFCSDFTALMQGPAYYKEKILN